MTGYGKGTREIPGKKISVEIRSLNSKQTDINTRLPWLYKEKEIEIRNIISNAVERGKVDFSVHVDLTGEQGALPVNKAVVKSYYRQLTEVAGELYIDSPEQLLSVIMRLPETLGNEREELSEDEWKVLKELVYEALDQLNSYREDEGKALLKDISAHIKRIMELLLEVEPFEEERIKIIRDRIKLSLEQSELASIDSNRFEQELIFYLEKLDINEEKVRLKKHCEYFLETTLAEGSNGKKLGFISQEIGREINTLGSKSNHAGMQKIVVLMKDELEKVKEQVLNIL